MAQDRKVFVGGVPQDLNQDDLYAIFSEYAGVKKAWLQKCRITDDGNGGSSCPSQNHRGFGFVIFHDAHAIDDLLGSAASRFIVLRSGAKLEVKRALSSNKMGTENAGGSSSSGTEGSGTRANRNQAARMGNATELTSNHVVGSSGQRPVNAQGQLSTPARSRALPTDPRAFPPMHSQAPMQVPLHHHTLGASGRAGLLGDPALDALAGFGLPPHVGPPRVGSMQPPGLSSVSGPPLDSVPRLGEGMARPHLPLREAIMRFYYEHCPQKLERDLIDFICSAYDGREEELDTALREKYGTGLQYPMRSGSRPTPELPSQRSFLKRVDPTYVDVMGMGTPPKPGRTELNTLGGQYWACPRESEVPSPDLGWVDRIVANDEAAEVARLRAELKRKEEWAGPQGYVW